MAKLLLKFENAVQKEITLLDAISIGRMPDNGLQIDNPAVSGHHCRIFFDDEHYVVEDNNSTNGTFVNNQRVTRAELKHGDELLIGKHVVAFEDAADGNRSAVPSLPRADATMVLDTRKAQEMMQQQAAASAVAPVAAKEAVGRLLVLAGKTDQQQYVLTGKLTVIGKSEMASVRLKGWFAPQVAAAINRHDDRYFIAAGGRQKVKVNGQVVTGQCELQAGDTISVAKVTMTFSYND